MLGGGIGRCGRLFHLADGKRDIGRQVEIRVCGLVNRRGVFSIRIDKRICGDG
jgi:hypothetical protein